MSAIDEYAMEQTVRMHPDLYDEATRKHYETTDNLADMLDFMRRHREVSSIVGDWQGYSLVLNVTQYKVADSGSEIDVEATRKELARWIKLLGTCEKKYVGNEFFVTKKFGGGNKILIFANRSVVCERKVVGIREVPAQPARTEELVEWECDTKVSFLGIDTE